VGEPHEQNNFGSSGKEDSNILSVGKESNLSSHVWVMGIAG
jgi:hypothetical protein